MDLAHRAAEDREVLRCDEDLPPADRSVARHDAVARRALLVHPEVVCPVDRERVGLDEGALVHQELHAARGRSASRGRAAWRRLPASGGERRLPALAQLVDPFLDGGRLRGLDALVRGRHGAESMRGGHDRARRVSAARLADLSQLAGFRRPAGSPPGAGVGHHPDRHDRVGASVERRGARAPTRGACTVVSRRPEVPVVLEQAPVLARGLRRRRRVEPALAPGDADRPLRAAWDRTEPIPRRRRSCVSRSAWIDSPSRRWKSQGPGR